MERKSAFYYVLAGNRFMKGGIQPVALGRLFSDDQKMQKALDANKSQVYDKKKNALHNTFVMLLDPNI